MWLSIASGLVKLAHRLVGWLDTRQKIEAGKTMALKEAMDETMELIENARRIDRDTSDLSQDARLRVRRALKRKAGAEQ